MKKLVALTVLSMIAVGSFHTETFALTEFKKAFQSKYVDDGSDEMKAAFKKASCNTCHMKGEKKDVRNEYGEELAKLIEGDANARKKEAMKAGGKDGRDAEQAKILEELEEAFKKVEKMKNKGGQVYGDLLKAGQLPVELTE